MGALLFCNQDILLLSPSFVLFSIRRFLWTCFVLWCLQSTGTRGISLKKSFAESWLHFVIERWRHVQGNHFLWPLSVPKCWESCRLWLGAAGLRAFLHLQHLMVCFSRVTRCPWKLNPFVHKFKKKKKYKPCTVRGNLGVSHSAPGRDSPGPPPGWVQQSHADTEGYGGESL